MIFAQTPVDWTTTVEHSVTITAILFAGYGLAWISRRLFGSDGIITLANEKNTETMDRNSKTLIELKELHASQQTLCTRHAAAMDNMAPIKAEVGRTVEASESVAASWAGKDADDFQTLRLTAGGMAACDVLDKLIPDSPELVNRVRRELGGKT